MAPCIMLSIVMLSFIYAECHMQALYHYAECRYDECRGAIASPRNEVKLLVNLDKAKQQECALPLTIGTSHLETRVQC
jgi:hypothetical protein